jgi:hypothetical protein
VAGFSEELEHSGPTSDTTFLDYLNDYWPLTMESASRSYYDCYYCYVVLGGLMVSVLAIGPKIRGSKPGWIFKDDKNL